MNKLIKYLFPNSLKALLRTKLGVPEQKSAFERIKNLGFSPKTVLDIGAYEGHWAKDCQKIFPKSKILMLEGQTEKETILSNLTKANTSLNYKIALLGAETKEVTFNIYDTASSVFTESNETNAATEQRTLSRLDDLVSNSDYSQPNFIKIDTQGYELEILKGAETTLKYAEFVLMEVSFLNIYNEAPLASEVISFMKSKDFVVYDICSLMRRPYDNALFQSDFLFIKESSPLRSSKRWA